MEVRQMATAFLWNQANVLMMRKAGSKLFHFEFWGGIGGHLEHGELNSPMIASYREIEEETGFSRMEIVNFRLKYILIEYNSEEVRQQYVYFGETTHADFRASDEGELYWIPESELASLYTSTIIKSALQHHVQNPDISDVVVGVATRNDEQEQSTQIQWSMLKETVAF